MSKSPLEGKKLRIATRGSALALWQANHVASLIQKLGAKTELLILKTTGDLVQDRFLHEIGGKGLFVKELEAALLDGRADLAMHSLKDMPAKLPDEFSLAAILPRHSPFDFFIPAPKHRAKSGSNSSELKSWLTKDSWHIATSSLRRAHILQGINKKIMISPIRGNVDTRLAKLESSTEWDGLILAEASLDRLSLKGRYPGVYMDPQWFLPSPAQGALAIETTVTSPYRKAIESLDDSSTRFAVELERGVLAALGGDCTMPFAAFARSTKGDKWRFDVRIMSGLSNCETGFEFDYAKYRNTSSQLVDITLAELGKAGLHRVLDELAHKCAPAK